MPTLQRSFPTLRCWSQALDPRLARGTSAMEAVHRRLDDVETTKLRRKILDRGLIA